MVFIDEKANQDEVLKEGSKLFNTPTIKYTGSKEARYDEIFSENKLLFTTDIVKEALASAYKQPTWQEMAKKIVFIIDLCKGTKNKNFERFAKLLDSHFEGIIAYGEYRLISGKIEGINNKIKTIRRQAYGFRDDDYFFLKIIDSSYNAEE